ncbi:hypothetical protein ISN45_At03g054400 [Arabidopsis thaliana x Arabidopsis arenosa]|uniref:Uncharacterized protein n=2 Tax=Arabidopsis TaxID=3701 RepID=A0A8T2FL43_ARASU|nr:hypothetical protein ISN45_At03g054400 [Arabidopsis thaliana x Arabidopsis arenosa]KAG7635220.1 hypothetical protein ISN44_As03g053360 [Arabidopsis suecica]
MDKPLTFNIESRPKNLKVMVSVIVKRNVNITKVRSKFQM